MKKLALILSLIVFVLSIAPCCALDDHQKQDEDCCQDCSPFYTCGTCGGFMITSLISFTTPSQTILPSAFNPSYLQSFTDGMDQNIWQPPKLS